jgi:CheY-like chemotaxis protein
VAEFDLLLIDMQMPVMGGLEACSLIRLTGFAEPVIALTANATEADKAEAKAAGCDDFLTKPIDQATFYATLERYLPTNPERQQRLIQPAQHNLQDDPEYQALKAAFLQELPERLAGIRAAATAQDWTGLGSQLHQLKGIAGSYGFPDISRLTGQMEQRLRDGDYRQVSTDLTELDRLGIC